MWIEQTKSEGLDNSTAAIGTALSTAGSFLVMFFLLPVYIFLILYYKPLFLEFISLLFSNGQQEIVNEVLGVIGALLNLIPYIGGPVAISIPTLMAIATKSPVDALWYFCFLYGSAVV